MQADIDRRLLIITNSDTADEAVGRFEESIRRLRKLDLADEYLGMLQDVEALHAEARQALSSSPDTAIAKHANLHALEINLVSLQQSAEGATPHLVDYIRRANEELRSHVKHAFVVQLNEVLSKILWPKKTTALPLLSLEAFNSAVNKLLALQKPLLEQTLALTDSATFSTQPGILYPFETMVEPLVARFHYHFSGDRPTNRLDKPEYSLNNLLDVLNTHVDFVNEYVQPLLLEQFYGSRNILSEPAYIDATTAFIHALLPMIRQRLLFIIGPVSSQPQLLSHLIAELLQFDNTLRKEWRYSPRATESWKGLTWEILTVHEYFPYWLQVEHDFALARYHSIIDDSSTSALDFDSVSQSANTSVPSVAALRIHDLLTTITHTYHDLPSFSHRLRFLIELQTDILDRFHARLASGLEAYLSMTSAVGRTVQGVSAQELSELSGVSGLDRLARIFGSAEYLERAMRDWSDDVFFLDMWDELQRRVRQRESGDVIKGDMSVADIAAKTSAAVDTNTTGEDDPGTGALFDEPADNYARLRARAEGVITDALRTSVKDALRPYARSASFASTTPGFSGVDLAPSPDLQGALRALSQGLEFLGRALAAAPLRRVARAVAKEVDTFIFDRVVVMRDYSFQGAKQLTVDVNALIRAMGAALGRKAGMVAIRRVEESLRLLGLPVEAQEGEDDEMTLWDVEKRLFATNQDARAVLAELGCVSLNESEGRRVLRCRVELES